MIIDIYKLKFRIDKSYFIFRLKIKIMELFRI